MSGPSSSPAGSGSDDLEALLAEELANSPSASSPPPSEGNDAGDDPRQSTPPAPRPLKKIKTAQESYCPPHPGYMGGLCIRCGMEKTQAELEERRQRPGGDLSPRSEYFLKLKGRDDGDGLPPGSESPKNMALNYIHHGLEVSKTEMERAKMATKRQALERKKLLLVLDLDHTLLNSTRMTDLSEEDTAKLHEMMQVQEEKYQAEGVPPVLYHLGHMNMWTKFRPGVREFLARSQKNFDLHVFTMGDKKYATEMVRLLDPSGSLFHGRVASRGDAAEGTLTKDLDVLLGSDDMMIILDDTEGVWPKHLSNLITMPRWVFELMNRSESTSRRGPTTLTRACVHSFIRPSVRTTTDIYTFVPTRSSLAWRARRTWRSAATRTPTRTPVRWGARCACSSGPTSYSSVWMNAFRIFGSACWPCASACSKGAPSCSRGSFPRTLIRGSIPRGCSRRSSARSVWRSVAVR